MADALTAGHLVWIDLEMTGLNPDSDRIIEIASVVTDSDLNILAQGPELVIFQSNETMSKMDEWNTNTHTKTGLIKKVLESSVKENEAEDLTLDFIRQHVEENTAPLCGNSICQDRRFLFRYMPKLEKFLHYRNLDVSVFKELAARWRPDLLEKHVKTGRHRALDDILESIEELKFYRAEFLNDL